MARREAAPRTGNRGMITDALMRGRTRAVLLTTLALTAFGGRGFAAASTLETEMRSVGFTDAQIATVRSGGLVTRLRLQREDNAAFVVAVTRIATSEAKLLDEIRSVGRSGWTPAGERTLQTGRFATPLTATDLQPLRLERQDLRDLARCQVGDCDVQLDRRAMAEAQRIDWGAPDAEARAARLLKTMLLERATAYLQEGNRAMAVYDDGPSPESAATGLEYILGNSPGLCKRDRPLCDYLLQFPARPTPADLEQFLFWSKTRVVKPVVSIVHAVIRRDENAPASRYDVVLKHVYDSHYFLAYAEFLSLLPEPGTTRAFYLVRAVRALVSPPHGLLRGILLSRIKHGMRDQLAEEVALTRRRLEIAVLPAR